MNFLGNFLPLYIELQWIVYSCSLLYFCQCILGIHSLKWDYWVKGKMLYVVLQDLTTSPPPGFPGGSDDKVPACNLGDPCLIPGLGRFPGEANGYPFQYCWLENSTRQRSLASYGPWGHRVGHDWVTNTFNILHVGYIPHFVQYTYSSFYSLRVCTS